MATRARTGLRDCGECKLMQVINRMEDGSMYTYYISENDYWRLRSRRSAMQTPKRNCTNRTVNWLDFLVGFLCAAGIFIYLLFVCLNKSNPSSPGGDYVGDCSLILWPITASLTFLIDNFPFKITGFIIFLLTALGYLPMIYWMGKLLKTNADLKQEEEKLIFEKEQSCANLNEIEKLNLELKKKNKANLNEIKKLNLEFKKKDNLNSTLNKYILNLDSQESKLRLQLQKTDKLNSKLELQNKDLQLKVDKKTQQNVVLKSEKAKLQSEKEKISLKLKEAKKLNVIPERKGSQLESQNMQKVKLQNHKLKLELEREKDQRLCDVCVDNFKNMLLLPCKHFSLCKTCWCHKKWSKCPICRQDIESAIDVYD